jgi:2-dehydrotetronate isomerase
MPRFSANLGFLYSDRPHVQRIADAGKSGFAAIEMHWPYDVPAAELKAAVDAAKVQMLGINAPIGDKSRGENGLTALPGREADAAAAFDLALSYVVTLGGTAVHCLAGVTSGEDAERTYVKNLAAFADKAAKAGKIVLIEPLNYRDAPGYFLTTIEQAAGILAKVERSNLKIMFDCYHLQIMGGDLIKKYERYRELVGHVQIASVPARAEPDEGELAYPEILKAFERLGYTGWIGAEYKPRAKTEDGLGWRKAYGS